MRGSLFFRSIHDHCRTDSLQAIDQIFPQSKQTGTLIRPMLADQIHRRAQADNAGNIFGPRAEANPPVVLPRSWGPTQSLTVHRVRQSLWVRISCVQRGRAGPHLVHPHSHRTTRLPERHPYEIEYYVPGRSCRFQQSVE